MKTSTSPSAIPEDAPDQVYAPWDRLIQEKLARLPAVPLSVSQEELARRIMLIIAANVASGRTQRFVREVRHGKKQRSQQPRDEEGESEAELTPAEREGYVERVITCYLQEYSRVEKLAEGDPAEWDQFAALLSKRAYRMLIRLGLDSNKAAAMAPDFAQETCQIVWGSRFPFDVAFDAWATLILNNRILQQLTRSRDLIDRTRTMLSLDMSESIDFSGGFSLLDVLEDPRVPEIFERVEVQEQLLDAIFRLPSAAQRAVIIYSFFYEMTDQEIGKRLDKTVNAIAILRHRALRRLRRMLKG